MSYYDPERTKAIFKEQTAILARNARRLEAWEQVKEALKVISELKGNDGYLLRDARIHAAGALKLMEAADADPATPQSAK